MKFQDDYINPPCAFKVIIYKNQMHQFQNCLITNENYLIIVLIHFKCNDILAVTIRTCGKSVSLLEEFSVLKIDACSSSYWTPSYRGPQANLIFVECSN